MSGPVEAILWREPEVGDYYRVIHDSDENLVDGEIIVVIAKRDDGRYEVSAGNGHTYYYKPEAMLRETVYMPDGEQYLMRKVAEAIGEVKSIEGRSAGIRAQLASMSAHVNAPVGDISEAALVPAVTNITEIRAKIATTRNDVALLQLDVKKRQEAAKGLLKLQKERMEAILKAQAAELAKSLGDLEGLIKKAEEAVWTINLYLGKNETIAQVAKGKPAPKDSKITIRQLVLYADEECAIDAEEGGIDFQNLREFDAWVAEPKHRRQVLPEAKGMVAFKVRRHKKEYATDTAMSMWAAAEADVANKKTYFLMANGENLYRICTDLEVGDRLFPKEDEHADLFFTNEYDYATHQHKKEPIYPGDERYMDAMEHADALKKHYLRILLFMQGLLDRTAVFAPLPAPRLNLLNRNVYGDHLVFVNDGEKLLGSGRPAFDDWLSALNAKLDVGHRIMGAFDTTSGLRQFRSERSHDNERIAPPGASYPSSLTLHTLEERTNHERMLFRYDRTDTVYRRWTRWDRQESGPAKRRASCKIALDDTFILNFDDARVEDMEFYLGDRTNRHAYERMFPLLRAAIELKKAEAVEEAPFRDLLAREIAKEYGVKVDAAMTEVAELVPWWKLKNRTHRALVSDDAKALRMIVTEAGARRRRDRDRDKHLGEVEAITAAVAARFPSWLMVGHKKGYEYVALVPEDDGDVWVREQVWRFAPGAAVEMLSEERWQVVERKRVMTWEILHATSRWTDWKMDARPSEHLTGPERDKLFADASAKAMEKAKEDRGERFFRSDDEDEEEQKIKIVRRPTILAYSQGKSLHIWIWTTRAVIAKCSLTGRWHAPEIEDYNVSWTKKKDKVEFYVYRESGTYDVQNLSQTKPWENRHGRHKILKVEQKHCKELEAEVAAYVTAHDASKRLADIAIGITGSATKYMKAAALGRLKAEFLAEYEHEELWEDHSKSIKEHALDVPHPRRVGGAARYLIERLALEGPPRAEDFEGMTFGELLDAARARGWKPSEKDGDKDMVPVKERITFEPWMLERDTKALAGKADDDDDDDDGEEVDAEDE